MADFNILYIIGPTASGKSRFAVRVAQKYNGVVINADSMQVYQGGKIITAVPEPQAMQGITHMLYNCVPPTHRYDVTIWKTQALQAIYTVLKQGKTPILCGGTGLYASAMIYGLSPIPSVDTHVRSTVRNMKPQGLYTALQSEDPIMAQRLHPNDTQRLARALEVIRSTGNSLSLYQNIPPVQLPDGLRIKCIALLPERQTVYDCINTRYAKMFTTGAIAEVQHLLDLNLPPDSQILRAIGVPEIIKYIRGEWDKQTAITQGKTATRRYAKRQISYIAHKLSPHIVVQNPKLFDIADIL